jgi:hypothetical protein
VSFVPLNLSNRGVHRLQPPNTSTPQLWGNHNMAPALGEAAFLCVDQMFVKEYNDSLASSVAPPCAARAA